MAAIDPFASEATGIAGPIRNAAAVSPVDDTDLPFVTRGFWIGGAGDLKVIMKGGQTVTFQNASGWMPIAASKVLGTGTTATGIVAGW